MRRSITRSNIIDASFDINGDGRVLRSEVKKVKAQAQKSKLKRLRRQGVSRSNILDASLDANGDGRVTRSEVRRAAQKSVMKAVGKAKAAPKKKPAAKRAMKRSAPLRVHALAVSPKSPKAVQRLRRTESRRHWTRGD
eukprot:TRINITY_DN29801_c0_g1_i1.p2 TRINITY_DN29801_c0_g1~~TRINITY_DN29801_c0_g1_i1.p2  ORF type:complete len:138 (+),score=29.27 TRINITY_DN29801_c0_g1_i1:74-487(+)